MALKEQKELDYLHYRLGLLESRLQELLTNLEVNGERGCPLDLDGGAREGGKHCVRSKDCDRHWREYSQLEWMIKNEQQ
ncbi:MAG: hypothetical protein ACOCVH_02155 [Verrucomicrobiota bacterium]